MLRDLTQKVKLKPIVDYIDGDTVTPADILPAAVSNPNSNEPLQQQRSTNPEMVEQALAVAHRVHVQGDWRKLPPAERGQMLEAVATGLEERLDEIALTEALTTGVVVDQSRLLADLALTAFQQAAQRLPSITKPVMLGNHVRLDRPPWGPAVLLIPWSASAYTAAQKIASALAAGCPIIVKPSEWAPHSCGILAEVIIKAGLPAGTFQLVNGGADVGATLVADPRVRAVSFSGSQESGRTIARICADNLKPAQVTAGGMNPLIVLEDADLELAVEAIVTGLTALNGQWTCGVGRLLIHAKHYHALLKRLLERLENLTIGDSLAPESDMGPLIHANHLRQMQAIAQRLLDYGGVIHELATLPDLPGYFMPPTLVTNCPPENTAAEMFGPLATAYYFKSDAEAIALANQPGSAQTAYIISASDKHAYNVAQEIQASSITINAVSLPGLHPHVPHSGWGLSGLGETGVTESIRFFTGTRAIGLGAP